MKQNARVPGKRWFRSRMMQWVFWGVVYVFAFYLGNVSGEYAAAKMPIFTFAMPRISIRLPSGIQWKGWVKPWKGDSTSSTGLSHTTLKFIGGEFLNVPNEKASAQEKQEFTQKIQNLAQKTDSVSISESCQFDPAFFKVNTGAVLQLVNASSSPHSIMLGSREQQIAAKQASTVTVPDPKGIYAVSCDGQLSGYYSVGQ